MNSKPEATALKAKRTPRNEAAARALSTGDFWLAFQTNPKTGVDIRYKERTPDYTGVGELHDFWELLYVDRGFVRLRVADREHVISEGHFILVAPRAPHVALPSTTVAPFYVTAHFQTNLELADLMNVVLPVDDEGRRLIVATLNEKDSSEPLARPLAHAYFVEFLIRALRRRRSGQHAVDLPTYFQINGYAQAVKKAERYIQKNFARRVTLAEVASAVGLSASHLEHIFKHQLGVPIMTYLQHVRIRQAKVLLLESSLNVSQIAEVTGYSSVYHFSRRFKKAVSVSPSHFAQMVRSAVGGESSTGQK